MLLKPNADFEKTIFYYVTFCVHKVVSYKSKTHNPQNENEGTPNKKTHQDTGLTSIFTQNLSSVKSSTHASVCVLLHDNNCSARTKPIYCHMNVCHLITD